MNVSHNEVLEYVFDPTKGQMNGWKWQAAVGRFYNELGWETEWEPPIWGFRGDIAARKMGAAANRIYTQCKCWKSRRIGAKPMWRLLTMAYAMRAEPVLAYYGTLNPTAQKIAKAFRVRLIDEETLQDEELPAPEKITGVYPKSEPANFSKLFAPGMPPHEVGAPDYKSRAHSVTEYPYSDLGEMGNNDATNQMDKYEPSPIEIDERFKKIGETIQEVDSWRTEYNLARDAGVSDRFTRSTVWLLKEFGVLKRDGLEILKVK